MRSIRELLETSRTIAVVGASTNPDKAAHQIPVALQAMGFDVIPVNPTVDELFGVPAYASLAEVPRPIDIVDVFRPPAEAADVAAQAVAAGAKAVWLQLGIVSTEARAIAEEAGIDYVEDKCLKVEAMIRGITRTTD
jgi:predicted CoA-binding protein